ncbi:MFS transporter (macronuclear) [Tetrahymena thermophila SB210]|uniref:Hexose transporter 1 n=1 Tax=Tetrahymena thermophila (strain SB210) TaxID=312017 RepID=I7MHW0_TETTS|nr:MFS transporter [Tetrahymena thermophila SB210]EAS03658.1 MFS transporter [Tetrahymena thermophila SB210]|eukprot:XP_001023903.1 MFS transporter [Tetrahymena thermophila SB210]
MRKISTGYTQKEVNTKNVYVRSIIISLGCLYFGYNNGSFNTTQQHISYLNGWITDQQVALYTGLITSALSLGCLVGSLITTQFLKSTKDDHRLCLMITDVIGILGIVEQIIDYNLGHFLLGRFLSGIACGLNTSLVPMYLQEFTPIIMRGKTGTFVQTFAQLGSFISISLGVIQPIYEKPPKNVDKALFVEESLENLNVFEKEAAWRIILGLPILMCLIRLIALLFVYTQISPLQMAQKNQLVNLKKLMNSVYSPRRALKTYTEIITQAQECFDQKTTNDEQFDNSSQLKQIKSLQNITSTNVSPTNKKFKIELEMIKQDTQQYIIDKDSGKIQQGQIEKDMKREQDSQSLECIGSNNQSPTNKRLKRDFSQIKQQVLFEPSICKSQDLKQFQDKNTNIENSSKPKNYLSSKRRLMLGLIIQTASRINGQISLTFYSSSIFQTQTSNIYIYLILQGAAGFLFTYISLFFIEKTGRKKLMLISTFLLMIAQLGIAIFSMINIFYLSFISIIFFLFAFGIGQGGVTWPYTVELVNKEHVSYCSAMRWVWVLVIGITFPFTNLVLGFAGTFFIYLGATFLCFLYFLKEMKETKNLTLEQIDKLYSNEQNEQEQK